MSLFIRLFAYITICFFLFTTSAYAVSITINNAPSTIGSSPFTLSATITGASPGINYLRVDLYKEGTTNYFGETYTGNDWYSGSVGTSYYPVTIGEDKTWTGTVQARIGDTIPADYNGTGNYNFRIRRYTASGNYNNDEAKASFVPVALVFPTLTPVPTNTPTPAPTVKPTKEPNPTATPKPLKSATPTTVNSSANEQSVLADATNDTGLETSGTPVESSSTGAQPTSILRVPTKFLKDTPAKFSKQQIMVKGVSNSLPKFIAVSIGGLLFIAGGILVFLKKKGIWLWKRE